MVWGHKAIVVLTMGLVLGWSGWAQAGGFMLAEQSQREIGRAFAGGAAAADEPATVYYNPAGMTQLDGLQISSGVTALFIQSAQHDIGTVYTGPGVTPPRATGGPDGRSPFAPVSPIPTLYVTQKVGAKWSVGLGVFAPFGLKLRYADNYFARYDSLYSNLFTLNISPSVAYQISDAVSVGGGVDAQYAKVTLTNALTNAFVTSPPSPALTLLPDLRLRVSGHDISFGWNAGVLIKTGAARIGLHYRSGFRHDLKGRFEIAPLEGAPPPSGTILTGLSAPLELPGSATASITWPLDEITTLMASGRWHNWSVFKEIRLLPDGRSPLVKHLKYKDSWNFSLGADRRISDRMTIRAGAMYDKTPTNEALFSTRVPDGNRVWASTGMSYDLSPQFTLNASYAHVFIRSGDFSRTDVFGPGLNVTTASHVSGNVDMLATSVTARF